jgi:hypothetical protein
MERASALGGLNALVIHRSQLLCSFKGDGGTHAPTARVVPFISRASAVANPLAFPLACSNAQR